MLKTLDSFKMFLVALSTFMTVELADSPLRTLSYLSVFMVASSNLWMRTEEIAKDYN
ncbi:MAG: hypothetical protein ACI9LV_000490 [Candidatus Nanohaloarchaea archaeon]|jgi:hypothetical protein